MKRYGNLYDKVCEMSNLELADANARKGKSKKWGVRLFDKNRDENLKNLQKSLLDGTFKTSEYKTMVIHEPKERLIYKLPYYPDRIVHHAIMNIVEPIWVGSFTSDTYANIKGRGIHACAEKLQHALYVDESGTRYCLKIDIKKYYPSIDNDLLKKEVMRKIKDKRLLSLIDEIIDSERGLPIGNYLSQYLANLFLSRFDHRIKEVHGARHYFPIRRRHGVSRFDEGRTSEDTCDSRERVVRTWSGVENELADIPRGIARHRLSRICFLPRIYSVAEKHKEEGFQAFVTIPKKRNNGRNFQEVYGIVERMDEMVRLEQASEKK